SFPRPATSQPCSLSLHDALPIYPFRATGDVDTIRAVLHGRVVPVQELHPDVPDDVAHVVMRLLERDPARRFASAGDVIAALEQRSEEHTSELQSRENLVCRLLLE